MGISDIFHKEPVGWETRQHGIGYSSYAGTSMVKELQRRLDYYNGNQIIQNADELTTSYVTPAEWNARWSGYGWDDIRAMIPDAIQNVIVQPVSTPFVKLVIDALQVVYAMPAEERLIKKDGDKLEDESALLNEIYKQCDHDRMSDQLCKWTGLFHTSFQTVSYDKRRRKLIKRNLPPFAVYVDPAAEDPTDIQHPECFVAIAQLDRGETSKDNTKVVWQCWYGERFWYETDPGKEYQDPALTIEGTRPNPYKDEDGNPVKPIVATHFNQSDAIYSYGSDQLVLMNQRLDRDLTALSFTMEYQGFSVAVAKGTTVEEMEKQPWSQAAMVILEDPNASLEFIHPAVQMSEFFTAAMKKIRLFARLVGLDPDAVDPETMVQSGVSRAQARIALIEKREQEFPKWASYEREAYWLTSIVWNTYVSKKKLVLIPRFTSVLDDEKYDIQVLFGEITASTDPLADSLNNINRIKANLITRAMVIASERRIPIEDAERIADEIFETNSKEVKETVENGMDAVGNINPNDVRIGQSGNRPTSDKQKPSDTGGNMTNAGGNSPVDKRDNSGARTDN